MGALRERGGGNIRYLTSRPSPRGATPRGSGVSFDVLRTSCVTRSGGRALCFAVNIQADKRSVLFGPRPAIRRGLTKTLDARKRERRRDEMGRDVDRRCVEAFSSLFRHFSVSVLSVAFERWSVMA